jgi:hypothetical protein
MQKRWVAMMLVLAACKSGAMDSAKEKFSQKYSCPEDSVEARVREDVTPTQLHNKKKDVPPAEVAADPKRLALWQKQQSDREARDDNDHVVEARGCRHQEIYSCGYASQHANTSSPWLCMQYDYPPGVKKW